MKSAIRAHSMLIAIWFFSAAAWCQTALFQQPYCGSLLQTQRLFLGDTPDPQDVGKSIIIGRLKIIESTKLTISRLDGVEQLVIVDASTAFFSDYGCAATLADFRVAEEIYAIGTVENGDFVATKLLKTSSGPAATVRPPCHCASRLSAEPASTNNLTLVSVGSESYLWQMWTKGYDVGHELPPDVPNTALAATSENNQLVLPPAIFP